MVKYNKQRKTRPAEYVPSPAVINPRSNTFAFNVRKHPNEELRNHRSVVDLKLSFILQVPLATEGFKKRNNRPRYYL